MTMARSGGKTPGDDSCNPMRTDDPPKMTSICLRDTFHPAPPVALALHQAYGRRTDAQVFPRVHSRSTGPEVCDPRGRKDRRCRCRFQDPLSGDTVVSYSATPPGGCTLASSSVRLIFAVRMSPRDPEVLASWTLEIGVWACLLFACGNMRKMSTACVAS